MIGKIWSNKRLLPASTRGNWDLGSQSHNVFLEPFKPFLSKFHRRSFLTEVSGNTASLGRVRGVLEAHATQSKIQPLSINKEHGAHSPCRMPKSHAGAESWCSRRRSRTLKAEADETVSIYLHFKFLLWPPTWSSG